MISCYNNREIGRDVIFEVTIPTFSALQKYLIKSLLAGMDDRLFLFDRLFCRSEGGTKVITN